MSDAHRGADRERADDGTDEHTADGTVPWSRFLREATERFRAAAVPSPEASARRIVEEASGRDGADLALALGEPASALGVAAWERMVGRRLAGEPLQYVVGRWGFRTLDLLVDRRVLIPRPETEEVAGAALAELASLAKGSEAGRPDADRRLRAADLGTGSGAIALALAAEQPSVEVWATDRSPAALAVARANLAGLGRAASRVHLREGWWFDALPAEHERSFDVIVSNPPYVAASDPLPPEVRDWEPADALVSGPRGLEALDVLTDGARRWLRPGGLAVFELAPGQADPVLRRARAAGYREVEARADRQGRERMVLLRR